MKINIPYNKAPVTESFDALHPVTFVSSPPSSVVFVSVVYTYADCLKNAPKLAIISFADVLTAVLLLAAPIIA